MRADGPRGAGVHAHGADPGPHTGGYVAQSDVGAGDGGGECSADGAEGGEWTSGVAGVGGVVCG